ncbi:MAG: FMN-dependent NADH-azoreductase [Alphaproteobacteria bacterium]|nr:MAG: FMN-dependent NADH-azoreductase [Alphaproteobacteria bacterium]
MTTALIVTSSANGEASVSSRLAATLAERLREADPSAHILLRDVGSDPLPHLTADTVAAIKSEPATEAELAARALSDSLVEELAAADILVIASPMYNFGMSSTLKAWFDHVLRAGVTFRYTAEGPEGLMTGKKAVLIESRAGFYSEGPGAAMDGQEPHIRNLLGFIGIDDVTVIRAEKLAFGPEAAEAAIAQASEALGLFAGETLKLAA